MADKDEKDLLSDEKRKRIEGILAEDAKDGTLSASYRKQLVDELHQDDVKRRGPTSGYLSPEKEMGTKKFNELDKKKPKKSKPKVKLARAKDGSLMEASALEKYPDQQVTPKKVSKPLDPSETDAVSTDVKKGPTRSSLKPTVEPLDDSAETGEGYTDVSGQPTMTFHEDDPDLIDVSSRPEPQLMANGLPEGSQIQTMPTQVMEPGDDGFLAAMQQMPQQPPAPPEPVTTPQNDAFLNSMNQGQPTGMPTSLEAVAAQGVQQAMEPIVAQGTMDPQMGMQQQPQLEQPQQPVQTDFTNPDADFLTEDLARRQQMTPDQRMVEDQRDAQRRQQAMAGAAEQKILEQQRWQARNMQAFSEANAEAQNRTRELIAKSEELATKKIDPSRWYKDRGVHQHAAGILAAAINGALNPGGPNQTLMQAERRIDADINSQVADLENQRGAISDQRGLVADLYEQGMTAFEAGETARIAAYGRIEQELAIEAAKYDPMGTTMRNIENARAEAAMKKEEVARNLEKHNLDMVMRIKKQALDEQEQRRKNMDTAADVQKTQLESALLNKKLHRRPGVKKPKPTSLRDAAFADEHHMVQDANGNWIKDPNWKPDPNQPKSKEELELDKLVRDSENIDARTTGIKQKNELLDESLRVDFGGDYEFKAKTPKLAAALNEKKPAVESATMIIDDLLAARHEHGAEMLNSQAGKDMDAKMHQLIFVQKNIVKGGALDQGLIETVSKAAIGGDKLPSKTLRKFSKALEGFREQMVNQINLEAEQAISDKKNFKRWEPPMRSIEKSRRRSQEERVGRLSTGVPEGLKMQDPELYLEYIDEMKADAKWAGKHDDVSMGTLQSLAKDIKRQRDNGEIDAETAMELLTPIAKGSAKRSKDNNMWGAPLDHKGNKISPDKVGPHLDLLDRVLDGDPMAIGEYITYGGAVDGEFPE